MLILQEPLLSFVTLIVAIPRLLTAEPFRHSSSLQSRHHTWWEDIFLEPGPCFP
ncbi:uncharacterized protein P884DRAFT_261233 [Thermothelomyces heterothallicus CBS 202.75]|uniref:uncharacterized protein n=1 Tax=Thermothelomyces heterothallicus CBS 202.75 TaxID=1149848 RepID=UPI003743CA8A